MAFEKAAGQNFMSELIPFTIKTTFMPLKINKRLKTYYKSVISLQKIN